MLVVSLTKSSSDGCLFDHISTLIRRFEKTYTQMVVAETFMDFRASAVKMKAWIRGLWTLGFEGAHNAAAGLT